jgi:hypothetical protein
MRHGCAITSEAGSIGFDALRQFLPLCSDAILMRFSFG